MTETDEPIESAPSPAMPRPLASAVAQHPSHGRNSLTAAAKRITGQTGIQRGRKKGTKSNDWQAEAWELYDLVGEQRFMMSTLGGRCGQARLYVGKLPDDPTEEPEPMDIGQPVDVFNAFGNGTPSQRAQLISRLAVNLGVAGDGWLLGIPRELLKQQEGRPDPGVRIDPTAGVEPGDPSLIDLATLDWRMLSVDEVSFDSDGTVQLSMGDGDKLSLDPDRLFLIRVWRPHPRRWWEADSPTRASLPVLRELVGLTMHISAQIDSRLAGAGVFLVPAEASDAVKRNQSQRDGSEAEDTDDDPFTEAMMEGMITPITDRSNASAMVPLVFQVPGDTVQNFKYFSFSTPLDGEARELRDEAIRRLALGQDAPPEILLGTGGMNHWGAWLVREDTITTHIAPPLALICDALTTQFLWPVLQSEPFAMSEEEAQQYVIWFDVDHLIMRPNRTADAQALYDVGAISAATLRDAAGFGDADAPPAIAQMDPAVTTALDLVKAAPTLAQTPGLQALVDEIRAVLSGSSEEIPAGGDSASPAPDPAQTGDSSPSGTDAEGQGTEGTPPDPGDQPQDGIAASATRSPLSPVMGLFQTIPPSDAETALNEYEAWRERMGLRD